MEINAQNVAMLRGVFVQLLSPENSVRTQAETVMASAEGQVGFGLVELHLISSLKGATPEEIGIRQIASVHFKNLVKKKWRPAENEDAVEIASADRDAIKTHLVDLMLSTPKDVQKQLSEAVSIIAKHDFPGKWTNLLSQLVLKLNTQDFSVIKGVLLTANSIMKRFRYVERTDNLFQELGYCLKEFQEPLLQLFQGTCSILSSPSLTTAILLDVMETLYLITRIFFSLNWQDIPEYFEDNINAWMSLFGNLLMYSNAALVDPSESEQQGPIEKLKAAIIENLNIYATKYDEEFTPHLASFTQLIWRLLMEVGAEAKYDILATQAIKFLTCVCSKEANKELFTGPIITDIVQHIVVRNVTASELDEELFEDNPSDYILKDMEGSDQDTRRRAASDLVRALLQHFNVETSQLVLSHVHSMLLQYSTTRDWKTKDAALHLILAVSVLTSTNAVGAVELNANINILDLFNSHVIPEISVADVNAQPIVKADAIKLICVFRSHLDASFLVGLLPNLIRHLSSTHVVVQTYAALCIEKFLSLRDVNNKKLPKLTKENLQPHLQSLFSGLFAVLDNVDLPENDYVMKCVMRVLLLVGSDIASISTLISTKLTSVLENVCKNPKNPQFNHYLFESLAVMVRSCCGSDSPTAAQSCAHFEGLLFPPFQSVLVMDVIEFVPYVFQILAQLLSFRTGGLSDAYRGLLPPLLSPVLWERKGNVLALVDLFKAYITHGMGDIVTGGHLNPLLGIFQKLLSSKATEISAFQIINLLFRFNSISVMESYMPTVLQLVLQRMSQIRSHSIYKHFVQMSCVIVCYYGAPKYYETLESIQPGLINEMVSRIWFVEENREFIAHTIEKKYVDEIIIGGVKLLCESPLSSNLELWGQLLSCIMSVIAVKISNSNSVSDGVADMLQDAAAELDTREFDASYSKLVYAKVEEESRVQICLLAPLGLDVTKGGIDTMFAGTLSTFCRTAGAAKFAAVIKLAITDPAEMQALVTILGPHIQGMELQ